MNKHTLKKKIRSIISIFGNNCMDRGINESVRLDLDVIYIAIPKTGTTSIRAQLNNKKKVSWLVPGSHLTLIQIKELFYPFYLSMHLNTNRSFPTEASHMKDSEIKELALRKFNSCFKFCNVRNPWARALSLYRRRGPIQPHNYLSFEEFCEKHVYASDTCIYPTLCKNQIDWITDENNNILVDKICKLENLAQDLEQTKALCPKLSFLKVWYLNVNPDKRNYRDAYNDKTRKIIAKRFEKDIDVLKYAF